VSSKRPPSDALERALDELYAASLDRFTSLRSELVARLRTAGELAASRAIAGAGKPTRTVWALNQIARSRPDLVAAILASRDDAAGAQKTGSADAIRAGLRRYRETVADAVGEARTLFAGGGVTLSTAQARRLAETLQTVAAGEAERRELVAGRLMREASTDEPFARSDVEPRIANEKVLTRSNASGPKRSDQAARRMAEMERARQEKTRRIDEARVRVAELVRSVTDARRLAARARSAALRAQAEAHQATVSLEGLEQELSRARKLLKRLT
jgi:hypothetical protein